MIPCIAVPELIFQGLSFLRGVVTDLQLGNLMMMATTVVLYSRFNLSEVSRAWLSKKTVNAFSHCLKAAKFNLDEACDAYARMLQGNYTLSGGRFIIDDTMEKHSKLCKFIHGVSKHWDHVFNTTVSAKCLVFLYYSEGGLIKFPIGWRIYYRDGEKTKNDLAIELIEQALERGFPCAVVLADSWFCVEPFVRELRRLGLIYILDLKRNASVRVPMKKSEGKSRGRKRKKWYTTVNIVIYMKRGKNKRVVGFEGAPESGLEEHLLYTVKERVCTLNALPGKHKVVYSYDPKRKTDKYLITNELTWEGLKVVKEYFHRWVIEEFFRNAKQQLNMEGACVRTEQGVTITLFLLTCIDSLLHMKIVELASANSETGPITVQSIVRLSILENARNFVSLIKSPEGEEFLDRWLTQLYKDAIRKRVVKSEVMYIGEDANVKAAKRNVAA